MQDVTLEQNSLALEYLKDISRMILQDTQNSIHKMQKEFGKLIANKDKEMPRLKNHSECLITQTKKIKSEKRSQQGKLEEFTS